MEHNSAIAEQRALNEYLSSIDAKEFLRSIEKDKKKEKKEKTEKKGLSLRTKAHKKKKKSENEKALAEPKKPLRPEEKFPDLELPDAPNVVKFLLYNIEVSVALIEVLIMESNYRDTTRCVLEIFRANRVEHNLIMFCLQQELQGNEQKSSLFRNNTAGTTLLSAFCKEKGQQIAKELLKPFFEVVYSYELAIEVDPNRCSAEEAQTNIPILSSLVDHLLERIYSYHDRFPSSLMGLFQNLHRCVLLKYPELQTKIIGGFFFLRFICPIIVSPDQMNITKGPVSATSRRTLILVSKIIQNISNSLEFGKKEGFMTPFNGLIREHIPKTSLFLEKLANPPMNGSFFVPKAESTILSNQSINREVRFIISLVIKRRKDIYDRLETPSKKNAFESFYNGTLKQIDIKENIGWVVAKELKEITEKPEEENTEFTNFSREAFLLAREALLQSEEEIKQLRRLLDEERILRNSMQNIILSMAESSHFELDCSAEEHIQVIKEWAGVPDKEQDFLSILKSKTIVSPRAKSTYPNQREDMVRRSLNLLKRTMSEHAYKQSVLAKARINQSPKAAGPPVIPSRSPPSLPPRDASSEGRRSIRKSRHKRSKSSSEQEVLEMENSLAPEQKTISRVLSQSMQLRPTGKESRGVNPRHPNTPPPIPPKAASPKSIPQPPMRI